MNDVADVERAVSRLLDSAIVSGSPPGWAESGECSHTDVWLTFDALDDTAVVPLHRVGSGGSEVYRASTVITRETGSARAVVMVGDGMKIGTIGARCADDVNAADARGAVRRRLRDQAIKSGRT